MKAVDLHTHSTCSDGTYTPEELMAYAAEKGLKAIALTDHDTVAGIAPAAAYIKEQALPLELVPGIELSTIYDLPGEGREQEVHVVGLFVDTENKAFTDTIEENAKSRVGRNAEICEKLTAAGLPVTYEELEEANLGAVLTRAHIAKLLLAKGLIQTRQEAFDRYIGDDGPCFVPRKKVTPFEAVELILSAGGVPVLAHPMLYKLTKAQLTELAKELKAAGLVGIEAVYSTHTQEEERCVRAIAKETGLLVSGGSDFHGANKPGLDLGRGYGSLFVAESILEELRRKKA
ncbi:MAG: PHP domain-containing protein [Lachnospiraceae bacterium]|nr:PHP domain-containing protein [Lachnospiraceae bacterium]